MNEFRSPEDIAESNKEAAFDVFRELGSLGDSLASYRVNVGDTIGLKDKAALRKALRTYDRLVQVELVYMKKQATKMSQRAEDLFQAMLDQAVDVLERSQHWGTKPERQYADIEPIEINPRSSTKKRKTKRTKNVSNVRSLVAKAMK